MVSMKKIFLVENEKNLRDLLMTYLINAGYKVTAFDNGVTAKNFITERPDVWVMNNTLPGMSGYNLIKEIKKKNMETPVIFMSQKNSESNHIIGLEIGNHDYLEKPFQPKELILRIEHVLKINKKNIDESTVPLSILVTGGLKNLRV
jgi:two-component system response regulator CssR